VILSTLNPDTLQRHSWCLGIFRGPSPRTPSTGALARPPAVAHVGPRPASTADDSHHPHNGGHGGGSSTRGGSIDWGGSKGWPSFYNPWTATISMWPGQALSASRPLTPVPALLINCAPYNAPSSRAYGLPPYGVPPTTPTLPQLPPTGTPTTTPWSPFARGWDPASLAAAYNTMALAPPSSNWVIDSSASYHTTPTAGMLSRSHPPPSTHPTSIVVGNGSTLPVTSVCASVVPRPFYLNDILVAPHITTISFPFVGSPLTILVPLSLTPLFFL
jgi:hypothetical protein